MKKIIVILLLMSLFQPGKSQDTITLTSADAINAEVPDTVETKRKLKKSGRETGFDTTIKNRDYLKNGFRNGSKDTLKQIGDTKYLQSPAYKLFARGEMDALYYYRGYDGAATGTLVTSLLSPLAGLIPAVVCTANPPKQENLDYPDQELFKNQDYRNGYTRAARKIKSRKVWRNWGIGLAVNVVLAIALSSGK